MLFIYGFSHHPLSVYKSIVFGEAIRLRRSNEKQEHYLESLEGLKVKRYRSDFSKKLINKIIKLVSRWTDRKQVVEQCGPQLFPNF